jgi:hypothetical protein
MPLRPACLPDGKGAHISHGVLSPEYNQVNVIR